jgi:hypothetical protein
MMGATKSLDHHEDHRQVGVGDCKFGYKKEKLALA